MSAARTAGRERVLGQLRYNYLFSTIRNSKPIMVVWDVLGVAFARFFREVEIGKIYEVGTYQRGTHDQQRCLCRVIRKVPLANVNAMLRANGTRRRASGEWYEVVND